MNGIDRTPLGFIIIVSILYLIVVISVKGQIKKDKYNDAVPFLIVLGSCVIMLFLLGRISVNFGFILGALILIDIVLIGIYKYITNEINWLSIIVFISFCVIYLIGSSEREVGHITNILGLICFCVIIYYIAKLVEASNNGGRTVYVSPTGKVYHTKRYCNGLQLNISMLEREAIAKGYIKCSRCR